MEFNEIIAVFAPLAYKGADEFLETLKNQETGELELSEEEITEKLFSGIKLHYSTKIKKTGSEQLKRGLGTSKKDILKIIRDNGIEIEDEGSKTSSQIVQEMYGNLKSQIDAKLQEIEDGKIVIDEDFINSNDVAKRIIKGKVTAALNVATKASEEAKTAYENKLRDLEVKTKQEGVNAQLLNIIDELNIPLEVEGDNDITKDLRIKTFTNNPIFNATNWNVDDKGVYFPVDKDGNQLENDTYQPITMVDMIKRVNPFGYASGDPNAGSPQPNTKHKGKGGKAIKFEDQKAFFNKLSKEKDPEKKKELIAAYQSQIEA